MKFGKEFVSQMVPEWQETYMDYTFLKNLLKDVQRYKLRGGGTSEPAPAALGLTRRISLYRAFSGLTQRHKSPGSPDVEAQAILVNAMTRDGLPGYETTFLMAAQDGGEYELVYFRRLDDELNKVERFYRGKVLEVVKEADMLDKQMNALIAFRIKVENPPEVFDRRAEMTRLATDVEVSAATVSASTPVGARRSASTKLSASSSRFQMDLIEEGPSIHERDDSVEEEMEEIKSSNNNVTKQNVKMKIPAVNVPARMAPLEVLGNVKLANNLETPRSTIKGVLKVPGHTELNFTRNNLRRVEEQLKKAFVEFHQKLRLLKSFSFLNILAFSKIMKKYDKITGRSASRPYMKTVDNSYIGSSDEVTRLIDRVEATFIKHFSNSNRAKGMNVLRPQARRERHRTSFSVGYFAGCATALLVGLIYVARVRKFTSDKKESDKYMDTMFPLYSLFGFIVLHLLMYGINIFYWRRYRVNYAFIFGFKQGTELGYRQVFLVGFGIAVLALLSVLSNLDMHMDSKTQDYGAFTELLPLYLIMFIFIILVLPFNVLYKAARYFFLTCLLHCICAPLYKVTLPDFFLGDQLTSQVQAFWSLETYVCYYIWEDFEHRVNNCKRRDGYNTMYFIVAVIPYLVRLLQCIRRVWEEKSVEQAWNGLKYFLTIVAVCLRIAIRVQGGIGWQVAAGIVSAVAATYCTWWDFVHDWGVLNRTSKNRWLRDKLLVPHKKVYYIAMVANVVLRFAWLQTVVGINFSFHPQAVSTTVACLEIIRRGIWNFFRLENEHLNNIGKYRAFKSVPLPFSYDEDDDKDE